MATSQLPLSPPPVVFQEDDLTQECRDLLSSLPREKGWIGPHLYEYQGFWHTPKQFQGMLSCQKLFQAQDTDILLVTLGTTWLKAILFGSVNRTRYPDTKHYPLLASNPHDLVPYLERLFVDKQVPDLASFASPRLFSTHSPLSSLPESVRSLKCKMVYLCKNPMDTFVSLWHFINKLRPERFGINLLEDVFDMFCRGVSLYGPFWNHVLGYWKESLDKPNKVIFLKYEEMKEKPNLHLGRLAEFLDCPFSPEEEASGLVNEILRL